MSNQSRTQVIAHVRDCRNRCTAFESNVQPARERVSGPTVAPTCKSASLAPTTSVQRIVMGPSPPLTPS